MFQYKKYVGIWRKKFFYSSESSFLPLDFVKSIFPKIPPATPPASPINGTKINDPRTKVAKKVPKNRPPEPKKAEVIIAKMKSRNKITLLTKHPLLILLLKLNHQQKNQLTK